MWCDLNKNIWPPAKFIKEIDQIIHQKIPTTKIVVYLFKSQTTPMPSKERIRNYAVRVLLCRPYIHIFEFFRKYWLHWLKLNRHGLRMLKTHVKQVAHVSLWSLLRDPLISWSNLQLRGKLDWLLWSNSTRAVKQFSSLQYRKPWCSLTKLWAYEGQAIAFLKLYCHQRVYISSSSYNWKAQEQTISP